MTTIALSSYARGKRAGETTQILVVDDDREVRNVVQTFLIDQGCRVSSAENAAEARRLIGIGGIDLALLDLRLPDESGLELTRHLREHSDVAIIILTGMGATVDRVVGLELGADDSVSKPLDLRELLARIRSVLRRTQTMPKRHQWEVAYFAGWRLNFTTRRLTSGRSLDGSGVRVALHLRRAPQPGAEPGAASRFYKPPRGRTG